MGTCFPFLKYFNLKLTSPSVPTVVVVNAGFDSVLSDRRGMALSCSMVTYIRRIICQHKTYNRL